MALNSIITVGDGVSSERQSIAVSTSGTHTFELDGHYRDGIASAGWMESDTALTAYVQEIDTAASTVTVFYDAGSLTGDGTLVCWFLGA